MVDQSATACLLTHSALVDQRATACYSLPATACLPTRSAVVDQQAVEAGMTSTGMSEEDMSGAPCVSAWDMLLRKLRP